MAPAAVVMPGLRPHLLAPHERLTYQQQLLIDYYAAHPQPIGQLARALGIQAKALTTELRGTQLMPVARQVALWHLLDENAST